MRWRPDALGATSPARARLTRQRSTRANTSFRKMPKLVASRAVHTRTRKPNSRITCVHNGDVCEWGGAGSGEGGGTRAAM